MARHVGKLYVKTLDETTALLKKSFDPIINEVETNKATTTANVQKKLTELKTALDKTNSKTTASTTENEDTRNKSHVRVEISKILRDLEQIENEITTPTEEDLKVRRTIETVKEDVLKTSGIFADKVIQEIENYWKGLSTTEQKEKQKVHDALTELKAASTTQKKLELLEKLFAFNDYTVTNTITW